MFLPQVWREGRAARFIWQPVGNVPKYSMIPLFVGTLKVTLVSMVVAAPVGVAAAVFTSEFAPRRLKEVLKPTIELLAGIPSVVLGFFALMVMATWLQSAFGFSLPAERGRRRARARAHDRARSCYTVSEDALAAVPRSYREASLALGATRWETAFKVVLPAAAPGVLAAVVLGFGRAIGETMIVLMASGNAAITSWSFGESVRTLPATIAAEMGEVVFGGAHYAVLFFLGVELFLFTFVLNTARRLVGAPARAEDVGGGGVSVATRKAVGRRPHRPHRRGRRCSSWRCSPLILVRRRPRRRRADLLAVPHRRARRRG